MHFSARLSLVAIALTLPLAAQTSPYRGLWVGEVTLNQVNEVTVPLDEDNVPRASDPATPTPTFDAARLRLLLHVDATGRTSLLKHVAILARKAGEAQGESDIALVTDERLYGQFPPQAARRISSAVFDFGDAAATEAVNRVVELAADGAADAAASSGATLTTVGDAAFGRAEPVIAEADAAAAYQDFLSSELDETTVRGLASGGVPDELREAAEATAMPLPEVAERLGASVLRADSQQR